jgi:hypothetical protein
MPLVSFSGWGESPAFPLVRLASASLCALYPISVSAWRDLVQFLTETGSDGAHRGAGRDSGILYVPVVSDCAALRSPWIFVTVVVIELAQLIWAERIDEPSHGSYALLWRQRRLGTAHIGPNPSGVDQNTSDAARRQIDRSASHHHTHRRLGAAIGNGAARRIVGERAHLTRDGDHQPSRTPGKCDR